MIESSAERSNGGEGDFVLTALAIAEAAGGRLIGLPTVKVTGVAPLDRASPSDLSFLASAKYAPMLASSNAGVVLISPELEDTPGHCAARVIVAVLPPRLSWQGRMGCLLLSGRDFSSQWS